VNNYLSISDNQTSDKNYKYIFIPILFCGALISTLQIESLWWRLIIAILGIASSALVVFAARRRSDKEALLISGALLGATLPIINLYGSGALLAVECFILAALVYSYPLRCEWAISWLAVLGASLIADIYWTFDITLFVPLQATPGNIAEALQAARQSPPAFVTSLLILCRWLTLIGFFSIAARSSIFIVGFLRTLIPALGVSLCILLFQYGMGIHTFSAAQAAYWSALNRYAGSFTDPNAFALVALLVLGVTVGSGSLAISIKEYRIRLLLSSSFVVFAICLSGSRTLLAGLALVVIALVSLRRKMLITTVVLLFSFLIILAQFPAQKLDSLRTILPESVVRVIKTVHPSSAREALNSRTMFTQIGFEMWRDNPLYGVGLGRFSQYIPRYAQRAGVDIGPWLDNANNFYLGILAELGICGAICLFLTISSLKFVSDGGHIKLARPMLSAFLLLLFLGPHLEFDEVSLLAALLAASAGVVPCQVTSYRYAHIVLICAVLFIVPFRAMTAQGISALESNTEGRFVWSGAVARFPVTCGADGNFSLDFRAPQLPLVEKTLRLKVKLFEKEHTLSISDKNRHKEIFPCKPVNLPSTAQLNQILELTVQPVFIPDKTHKNGDFRRLGVQIFSPVI
jgi:O-antigen ligase